ncbi:MAG TPA: deoxyribonuclease IV [Longimicrobiales bacterium]|nr:deoxyribonuclease IV [Longimicrobiales bacterium]
MAETPDELGAHVSAEGGLHLVHARAAEVGARVLQLFTKQPSRWAEPKLSEEDLAAFAAERRAHAVVVAVAHDSYLINLASPDRRLRRISQRAFGAELQRSQALGLDFVVTHPGNAMGPDLESGIARNADAIAESLESTGGSVRVALELTSGSGTSVGGTFEHLRAIIDRLPAQHRARVGVCVDTCHAYSAGYDLVGDYDGVWARFDDAVGLERLWLLHLNDSKHPFASRRDRHEAIGKGSLGLEPFRRIMRDERLRRVPKILETPKEDDAVRADRANLALLRSLRAD